MENVNYHFTNGLLHAFLQTQAEELFAVIERLEKSLKSAPAGSLTVSPHQGDYQYYQSLLGNGKKGKYIPNDRLSLAKKLAQRDYDKKVLHELRPLLKIVDKCIPACNPEIFASIYKKLHPGRRALVCPIFVSNEDYVKEWLKFDYVGRPFDKESPELTTANGERVRSKSEIIIADTLLRLGVPYRYEYPYRMMNGRRRVCLYPDFTCLNVRTRQEFIWEHFGLIEDIEYANNMLGKMELFAANGYFSGLNLITTSETQEHPLNSSFVERLAGKYLL